MDISYTITVATASGPLLAQSATLSNRTAEQVAMLDAKGADMVKYARGLVRPEGDCSVTLQFGAAVAVVVEMLARRGVKDLLTQVADEWVGNGIKQ